jgi:hypothetical protein
MVVKTVKRHIEINTDFLKLKFRNMKKTLKCPICDKHVSKIKTLTFCKKCDETFSKLSEHKKKTLIKNVKHINPEECFLCSEKNLESENKLFYCVNCDISFHE